MKRTRITLVEVAGWDNLSLATWKAARGKRHRPDVTRFLGNMDRSLQAMREAIMGEKAPFGRYRSFYIHDPKRRLIHAACFEDRVLHHAIMNLAEPVFERSLVLETYACRPGKGVHRAVVQVQKNLRRFPWFVKIDVDSYFPSIDHPTLLRLLRRRFKGNGFLNLLERIVGSYSVKEGKGLPIGSLTSQHFANFYLNGADRLLLQHPQVCSQVRYMDDIIWWCCDRFSARKVLEELREYLGSKRGLSVKPGVQVNRSQRGVTYCGYRVLPGRILLTPRKRKRYRQQRRHWEWRWQTGEITGRQLQAAYDSVHAITLHADSAAWRRRNLQLLPGAYIRHEGGH